MNFKNVSETLGVCVPFLTPRPGGVILGNPRVFAINVMKGCEVSGKNVNSGPT